MDIAIRNGKELQEEILRLKELRQVHSEALRERFKTPKSFFSTVISMFPAAVRPNYVGMASRIIVPFVLNRTLFRNSGFLIRGLVGLVSQKAAGYITEESIEGGLEKLISLVGKDSRDRHYTKPL
jgi:hypothetical protein